MKQISAMMAGVVIEVLVKSGDLVKEGEEVVILESMKMHLPVTAALSGKVSRITVNKGDFVNEGDPLLLLE